MQGHLPTSVSTSPECRSAGDRSQRTADRAYQTLTIAAILIVLCSLWVF